MIQILSHTFRDRSERMRLIRDRDFDRYFAMLDFERQQRESVARMLMYAAERHGCVLMPEGDGRWQYLHRSAKYDCLQFTTWDMYGPVCDVAVMDEGDLLERMTGGVFAYA